jgi:hypothetical protein
MHATAVSDFLFLSCFFVSMTVTASENVKVSAHWNKRGNGNEKQTDDDWKQFHKQSPCEKLIIVADYSAPYH